MSETVEGNVDPVPVTGWPPLECPLNDLTTSSFIFKRRVYFVLGWGEKMVGNHYRHTPTRRVPTPPEEPLPSPVLLPVYGCTIPTVHLSSFLESRNFRSNSGLNSLGRRRGRVEIYCINYNRKIRENLTLKTRNINFYGNVYISDREVSF